MWTLWLQFFNPRVEAQFFDAVGNSRPGVVSNSASGRHATTAEWAVLLNEWQIWLRTLNPPRAPEGARQALVRIFRSCRAENEVLEAFNQPHVRDTASGIRNRISQRQRAILAEQREQLPVTNDVLYKMFDECETGWNLRKKCGMLPSSWHKDSWYRFLPCLAGWTAKHFELRASEYCHVPDHVRHGETVQSLRRVCDPHALRPEDVLFHCKDGSIFEARQMHDFTDITVNDVDFVQVYLRSAKNISNGNYAVEFVRTGVSTMMDDYVWLLLTFTQYSFWHPGDIFFSMRYPLGEGALKQLIPKMVTNLLQSAVIRMGGPPNRYGTKSFKIGGITDLFHAGASEADLLALGRHATVSANRHYRRNVVGENVLRAGPLALGVDRGLTLGEVMRGSIDGRRAGPGSPQVRRAGR